MTHTTNSKELMIGDLSVIVRELTVLQVRTWLADMQKPDPSLRDLVDDGFFEECSVADICRMSSMTVDQINALRPSQVLQVIAVCKELNPDFFGFRRRLGWAPLEAQG
ncbi:hypothetical protein [Stutzerimonas nitrititolerans]|uniref:hypothetical protein n=1 Tax=Stutzerimonas nitrititolerans TaxID=2482751 RepID=UPI0028A67BCF|nr:hypothetical protein [Stutzerimonas nitrititolerans]